MKPRRARRRAATPRRGEPPRRGEDLHDRLRAAVSEALVAELEAAGVERVIDVRFRPQSRRPGMSKTRLGELLGDHGIAYEHRRALGTPADLRFLFHSGASPRGPRPSASTSSARRRMSSTRSPRNCRAPRGPRCCAWRPTPPSATAACSPPHCKSGLATSVWSIYRAVDEFRYTSCAIRGASRHPAARAEARLRGARGPRHPRLHHMRRTDHSSTNP